MDICPGVTIGLRQRGLKNSAGAPVRYRILGAVLSRISRLSAGILMSGYRKSKPDRRVQRTQKLLHQALVSLLAERPYEAITVKDILERAEVGRSTFYMHFHDKDALLISGIRQMLSSAYTAASSLRHRDVDVLGFSLPMFQHILQHRRTAEASVGAIGWAVVHEHLRGAIAEMIAGDLKAAGRHGAKAALRVPTDLLVQHVASTFILVLRWCIEQRSALSAKEVDNLFRALLSRSPGTER